MRVSLLGVLTRAENGGMQLKEAHVVWDQVVDFEGQLAAVEGEHIHLGDWVLGDIHPSIVIAGIQLRPRAQLWEALAQLASRHRDRIAIIRHEIKDGDLVGQRV